MCPKLTCIVPVYTYHKTEIDDDLIEVDDDFWPSVNAVKELPNDLRRLSSYNNFTDKKQNGCC